MEPQSSPTGEPQGPQIDITCPFCHSALSVPVSQAGQTASCPKCEGNFQVPLPTATASGSVPPIAQAPGSPPYREFVDKKLAAGICGIVLGAFGVHKFILGLNNAAIIMLAVSLGGAVIGSCLFFPLLATLAMQVIGLIEGIMYLTKSDEDFYQTYAVQKKEWL